MRRSAALKRNINYSDNNLVKVSSVSKSNSNLRFSLVDPSRDKDPDSSSRTLTHQKSKGHATLRNSFRKSLRQASVVTLPRAFSTTQKNTSVNTTGGSKSELNFLNSTAAASDIKSARVQRYQYRFLSVKNVADEVKRYDVEVRTQSFAAANSKGTLRGSLVRWKKNQGSISVHDGCVEFEIKEGTKATASLMYEVGNIEDLSIVQHRSSKAKEFTLMFYGDDKLINIRTSSDGDCEELVRAIFVEARKVAAIFEACLSTLLPEDWQTALQNKDLDANAGPGVGNGSLEDFSQDVHVRVKKFDEKEMMKAEICLRERLDLIAFSRGDTHMECFEAEERLGKWLEYNGHLEEAQFWTNHALQGFRNRSTTANIEKSAENISALEELRNPIQLEKVVEMRSLSSVPDIEVKVQHVMKVLDDAADSAKKQDQFVDLI